MGLIFDSDLYSIELLLGLATFFFLFYKFWTRKYDYWKKRGIPCLEANFPFGNGYNLIFQKQFVGEFFGEMYFKLKGHRYGGIINLATPQLLVRDPELIKHVMTKDFSYFVDRGTTVDIELEPILGHLFNLKGDTWRNLRAKLTPTFTSGKMKLMFHIMKSCADHLGETLQKITDVEGKDAIIEMKDYMARFGMDVIGSCAFGLDIGAINEPDNCFRKYLSEVFKQRLQVIVRNFMNALVPGLGRKMKIRAFPKEANTFFSDFVRKTVDYRENSKELRNDFLDLLIQIKNKGKVDEDDISETTSLGQENPADAPSTNNTKNKVAHLSDESMTAQCFVFFVAGFETSSTTLSFCLHELAVNRGIQKKLQEEVDTVLKKHNGQVTYESLKEMTYMDTVVSETLRKYPPVAVLQRECQADYKIPGTDTVIEKNMKVFIALYGLHYDPKFYPDPEKFDPERFTEEGKRSRPSYAYLPFGEGPRVCIGLRFGWMQVKMGLTTVLSKYNVEIPTGGRTKLQLDPKSFVTSSKGGIKLKVTKRS